MAREPSCPEAYRILVSQLRIEPTSLTLEGELLTTGLPGKVPLRADLEIQSDVVSLFFFFVEKRWEGGTWKTRSHPVWTAVASSV